MRLLATLLIGSTLAAGCGTVNRAPADAGVSSGADVVPGDIVLGADAVSSTGRVEPGVTLQTLLRAHAIAPAEASALVGSVARVFDLRTVKAGHPYAMRVASGGAIRSFDYEIDGDRVLHVDRPDDRLVAAIVPIPKTRSVEVVRGRIDRRTSSLMAAVSDAGETVDLALSLAEIFGGEIDFNAGLQPGDTVELTVEKQYRDHHTFAGYGPILAAEFVNAGRHVRAVRFTPEGGTPGYFDERGISMRRFLLASPLKFQPAVTSAFSRGRLHPILHEVRAHLGVDYRAPAGAPVVAVADGVVVSAAANASAGRMVHLRHTNGLESQYLHLSSMTVRAGMRVRQGELVGRVGSSGLATAPHLDFRLKKNGVYINPVTAHRQMPPSNPVPHAQMSAFVLVRTRELGRLDASAATAAARRAD